MLLLKDTYRQKSLQTNGYFTIPFLEDDLIEQVKEVYNTNFDDKNTSFYATSFHPDFELKQRVNEQLITLLQQKLDAYFIDYKLLGTAFLKKQARQNNPLPLHQDWTVTDEEKYGSFTIWIPLQDTTVENGAIRVIGGSHCVETNYRAPSLPVSFESERAKFELEAKTLLLKKGEAFVFNHKVMHSSFPNTSNEDRIALTIGLVPKDAELFMLYYDNAKHILQQYAMPDSLFLYYPEIISTPKIGTLINSFKYIPKTFTYSQFKEQLYSNRTKSSTMKPLFQDEHHQSFFEQNGYVKLPVLDADDIKQLTDFLYTSGIKKETDYGFYVGMDHEDKKLVTTMMETVECIAMPKVANYLKDYQLITASYVIKDPNPKGVVPPHQDWTFVEDETQHCSVTCWISLVDTTMENGCIGVIKGSHKFFNSVRPSPSPQVPSPLAKHMFSLFPYFQLLPTKAGEALIFDNRTFHASPPNITSNPRLAVGLSFTQRDAQLRHYYLKPNTKNTLLKYKIDANFFTKYDNSFLSKLYDNNKQIEGYELMEELPYVWEDLSKQELNKRVIENGNTYNEELTNHMKLLFGNYMKDTLKDKAENFINAINPIKIVQRIKERIG